MLLPYRGGGQPHGAAALSPVSADVEGDTVRAVTAAPSRHRRRDRRVRPPTSSTPPSSATCCRSPAREYVNGFESAGRHRRAQRAGRGAADNVQAVSICFAIDHVDGDQTIDKPRNYDYWRAVPAALLGRAAARLHGAASAHPRDRRPRFTPNPDDDPLLRRRRPAQEPAATRTCGPSAASRRGATSCPAPTPPTSAS